MQKVQKEENFIDLSRYSDSYLPVTTSLTPAKTLPVKRGTFQSKTLQF